MGVTLIYTGTLHLTTRRLEFQAQVPPWAPFTPDFIVLASGIVEIALGLSLISLQRRREVGIATAALFIAIFPGNISQFVNHIDAFGLDSDRARAIRLLFQPLLVLWALWSTTVMPKGTFKRFRNYVKKTIRENKIATVIGILIGGAGTRYLEDGKLLISAVLIGMCTFGIFVLLLGVRRLFRHT